MQAFEFPGSQQEAFELTMAVTHNCRDLTVMGEHCPTEANPLGRRCAAHGMLLEPATVGRLVFFRRIAAKLMKAEWA